MTCPPVAPWLVGIGGALVRASRLHRSLAMQLLGEIGIYPGQEVLLMLVGDGESTPRQLAVQMQVEPPTITKMAQRLEAAGFVERVAATGDMRSRPLRLTPRGRDAAHAAASVWDQLEQATRQALTPGEQVELERLLRKVVIEMGATRSGPLDACEG